MIKKSFTNKITFGLLAILLLISLFLFPSSKLQHQAQASENVTYTEFSVPTINPTDSQYTYITSGPDGNIWFINNVANYIGRMTPDGTVTQYPVPTSNSSLIEITSGPDGNLWFTEGAANKIGRITSTGNITEFPLSSTTACLPSYITGGPDGNVWFTEGNAGCNGIVGRITPNGVITEFPIPSYSGTGLQPSRIANGPDGNLWFLSAVSASDVISKITTSGNVTEYNTEVNGGAGDVPFYDLTGGPDGNVWFTEWNDNKVGYITPNGNVTDFPLPSGGVADAITKGPDGNLWFINGGSYNTLGQVTPSGTITEFADSPMPIASAGNIITGPDGNLWYAAGATIVRVNISNTIPTPTSKPTPTPKPPIKTIVGIVDNNKGKPLKKANISITCNGQKVNTKTGNVGNFIATFSNTCPFGSTVIVTVELGTPYLPGTTETGSRTLKNGDSTGKIKLSLPIPPLSKIQTAITNWALKQVGNPTGMVNLWEGIDKTVAWGYDKCLPFAFDVWFEAGVPLTGVGNNGTALTYWETNPDQKIMDVHLACPQAQTTGECPNSNYQNTSAPPLGAMVFWGDHKIKGTTYPPHVAISLGNSSTTENVQVVSTPAYPYYNHDGIKDPRVFTFPLSQRDASTYNYLGWMMPK